MLFYHIKTIKRDLKSGLFPVSIFDDRSKMLSYECQKGKRTFPRNLSGNRRERMWQEGEISIGLNTMGEFGAVGWTGEAASAEGESRVRNHN